MSASAGTVSARKTPLELTAEYSKTGLKETRLAILNGAGKAVRTESLPYYVQSYKWNARNNSNAVVEDGVYSVQFTAVYYNGTEVNKTLSDIVIDSTPPEITEFAPNAKIIQPYQAEAQNAVFSVVQKSSEEDVTWHAEIRNILNEAVFSKDIEALDTFTWNGRAANGEIVPDGDYFYMISAEDAAGNKTERTASFAVDTGIYEDGMVLTINDPLPVIYFSPYSSNLFAISKDKNTAMYQNLLHIRSIARLLKTDESYKITITGHAAKLLRGNAAEREQNEVLIPLSTARAAFVSNALVILGISEDRITVKSAGGSFPAVQNPSAHDIWQNRRVEFEITKGVQRAQENM